MSNGYPGSISNSYGNSNSGGSSSGSSSSGGSSGGYASYGDFNHEIEHQDISVGVMNSEER